MEPHDLIVLTPPNPADSSLAIAACRAGAVGVLDLEFPPNPDVLATELSRLARHAGNPFGVLLRSEADESLLEQLLAGPLKPHRLIFTGCHPTLPAVWRRAQEAGIEVFLEAVSISEAINAGALGVAGLILKGHEAAGRVGPDTSFVLIQKWKQQANRTGVTIPFWVRGGIGPSTAAAALAAGARGVVLDSQVLLARESPLQNSARRRIASLDGSETTVVGTRLGEAYRVYSCPDSSGAKALAEQQERLLSGTKSTQEKLSAWREAVRAKISLDPDSGVWPVGQDVASAAGLAARGITVAGIVDTLCERAVKALRTAGKLKHIAESAPLAKTNGTRYPIFQGPMTRVSDSPAFANAVATGGALPFLALAMSRKVETEHLLKETRARLGAKPWGVGVAGFVPAEIREEQLEAIRIHKPPFAIIAGGRPDQAKVLEEKGIAAYLHVSSPTLLKEFLKDGAKRFIFEGQECGGHTGPRSSFALWESAVEVINDYLGMKPGDDLHVVFAGGVHDGLSARMVAALSASLAEKGVKVGVLLGTAYLFTKEAVETAAITTGFQRAVLACEDTVLLESGPDHAIRCIPTPYVETFEDEKRKLLEAGKPAPEVEVALEKMNLGRVRVASKGVDRAGSGNTNGTGLTAVPEDEQFRRGLYMIGQIAALRNEVTTIANLHAEVCSKPITAAPSDQLSPGIPAEPEAPPPCDVAIIGLSCFYPGAIGLQQYWHNILGKVNAVIEIPPTHWDWRLYYDPDPRARDKMISKWGGFMGDVVFDPLKYGITPKSIPNIEPLQLLLLEAVNQALGDAGYLERPFARERTCAILGVGGGGMPLSVSYGFRSCMPLMDTIPGVTTKSSEVIKLGEGMLPEWTEDSFPGILLNVAAGRVANRFNLGGTNMAIDAACGSSLAALYAGVRELNTGTSDVAIVMGGDAVQTPYAYVAFSKTHALSPRGRCRPFDAAADGIALAEGVGIAVLKRLADAERDGDRIYAVIKGVGASSDGRDKGLTAPRAEGQLRALHRAYAQARLSPARVGLVEAHGTGTVVGDQTEASAIGQLFREAGGDARSCALGSVKSMIGHSKCAAGLAGLIKTAFALHHKVLPPTLVEVPNPKANLDDGPLYLNTEARPWVHGGEHPRTAGVSAFGFGGTNFHTVLEEYTGDYLHRLESGLQRWPAELFVWRRPDINSILASVRQCRDALAAGASPIFADLAASVWQSSKPLVESAPVLAIVATSLTDLKDKIDTTLNAIGKDSQSLTDPRGIYFNASPSLAGAKVAFLFPGQGSQYPDMLAQVAIAFQEVRESFDRAESTLAGELDRPLGKLIFPPSPFTPEQEAANRQNLQRTEVAQPAVGAAGIGMFHLLTALGIQPAYFAGHSYGEYAALAAAGALGEDDLYRLSYRRGQVIRDAAASSSGGMLAVDGTPAAIAPVLDGMAGVWVANHNSPHQTVLAGTEEGLKCAAEKLQAAGVRSQRIPVACGFHSPLIAGAKEPLDRALAEARFSAPRLPVFSNTTAAPHATDPAAIAKRLADHLVSPVKFADEIAAMYAAGARVFVEVGPQAVLTGLTGQILAGKPHLAVASDQKARPGLVQLAHMLGQLLVAGIPARLDRLFQGRAIETFDLAKLGPDTGKPRHPATAWMVNGVRSRPINGPEPRLLGQTLDTAEQSSKPTASTSKAPETRIPRTRPAEPKEKEPQKQPASPHAPSPQPPAQTTPALPKAAPQPMRVKMNNADTQTLLSSPSTNGSTGQGHREPAAMPEGAAAVMLRFQEVMSRFLDTQRAVMLGYLGSGGASPPYSTNGHAELPPKSATSVAAPASFHAASPVMTNRLAPAEPISRPATPTPSAPPVQSFPSAPAASTPSTNGKHEPVTVPAAEVTVAPAAAMPKPDAAPLDRDALLARLLDLVSDRTGYPKEALSIDLDLEADLGVDSIKRVEILGALAETLETGAEGQQPNLEMEKLSTIKTLRGIADYVTEALENTAVPAPSANGTEEGHPAPSRNGDLHPGARKGEVQRLVVRLVDTPLPIRPRLTPPSGAIVLTDDRRGTARDLADRLAEFDVKCVLVRMEDGEPVPEGTFAADLTDPAAVNDLLALIHKKCGPVAGLIHLLPLAEAAEGENPAERARREVKSLYLLARGMESEIRSTGKTGGAVLLAVTAMGGTMGFGANLPEEFSVGHGGVAGFTKCLGHEWPEVTVRVVDVDGETPATHLTEILLGELGDHEGPFEVGRNGDRRVTWQVEPGPLAREEATVDLGPDSTILITGGARGITAKIAEELAKRYQSRLVLVGSSQLPADEPEDIAGLTVSAEIKAALLKKQPDAKPAIIEAVFKRLMKDREIRANLEAIRNAGSKVDYRAVDVRDPAAFGSLIDELNAAGGISGVIHGAGVIEDKLLRDKTPESFDRVFSTKVDSALTLAKKLDSKKLKFLALFASITSRYGNRGQSDYAAANEVLSKLACDLDRRWPGRVFSIAWGPWAEVGMVAELEKHLVARGLKLIEPSIGAGFAVDEVVYGSKGEPEVLVAGGTEAPAVRGAQSSTATEAVAVGAE